jgi:thioesterase domain-containing protein
MESGQSREHPFLPLHFQIAEIWQRLLKTKVRSVERNFFDLGGGPSLLPKMLAEVQRVTGKQIQPADFLDEPTIKGLARCICRNARTDSVFVPIQPGSEGAPFYFFHGDILGAGIYSKRLATLLGEKQPVHVSPPLEIGDSKLPRVEDLAARKRKALRKLQPHGPYLLGGFCVGAVIAYEVARQLEAEGEQVSAVLLIEPEIGDVLARSHLRVVNQLALRRRPARDKVQVFVRGMKKIERLRNVWRSPWQEKTAFVINNTKKLLPKVRGDGKGENTPLDGENDDDANWALAAYQWILTSYVPRRYSGRVTMLLTRQQMEEAPFIVKQWRKAASQLRVERIPGNHLSCITTHLEEIAKKIRKEINLVQSWMMMLMPAIGCHLSLLD